MPPGLQQEEDVTTTAAATTTTTATSPPAVVGDTAACSKIPTASAITTTTSSSSLTGVGGGGGGTPGQNTAGARPGRLVVVVLSSSTKWLPIALVMMMMIMTMMVRLSSAHPIRRPQGAKNATPLTVEGREVLLCWVVQIQTRTAACGVDDVGFGSQDGGSGGGGGSRRLQDTLQCWAEKRSKMAEHARAVSLELGLTIHHTFGQFYDHLLLCHTPESALESSNNQMTSGDLLRGRSLSESDQGARLGSKDDSHLGDSSSWLKNIKYLPPPSSSSSSLHPPSSSLPSSPPLSPLPSSSLSSSSSSSPSSSSSSPHAGRATSAGISQLHRMHSELKVKDKQQFDLWRRKVEERLTAHPEVVTFSSEHAHRRKSRLAIPPRQFVSSSADTQVTPASPETTKSPALSFSSRIISDTNRLPTTLQQQRSISTARHSSQPLFSSIKSPSPPPKDDITIFSRGVAKHSPGKLSQLRNSPAGGGTLTFNPKPDISTSPKRLTPKSFTESAAGVPWLNVRQHLILRSPVSNTFDTKGDVGRESSSPFYKLRPEKASSNISSSVLLSLPALSFLLVRRPPSGPKLDYASRTISPVKAIQWVKGSLFSKNNRSHHLQHILLRNASTQKDISVSKGAVFPRRPSSTIVFSMIFSSPNNRLQRLSTTPSKVGKRERVLLSNAREVADAPHRVQRLLSNTLATPPVAASSDSSLSPRRLTKKKRSLTISSARSLKNFDKLYPEGGAPVPVAKVRDDADAEPRYRFHHTLTGALKFRGGRRRLLKKRESPMQFNDPAYPRQWHLYNRATPSMDINVTDVWRHNITGRGVTVAVVDDGVEWRNPDLKANYNYRGSWDLNDNDPDPSPSYSKVSNHHGTRCAGEIAAVANNHLCGVGVAYGANIAGVRVLDGVMTDSMEAEAFNKNMDVNAVFSCSWGPDDDGATVDGPHLMAAKAMKFGVDFGRAGFGSVFVVASGNGGENGDNCNFDGYANSIYTVTIGAVDEDGGMPYYAEECASMLGVTFSSGTLNKRDIVTTDWLPGEFAADSSGGGGGSAAAVNFRGLGMGPAAAAGVSEGGGGGGGGGIGEDAAEPGGIAGGRSGGGVYSRASSSGGGGCTERHTGTSAAAPLAAGMVALMLEARPCLTWRDVQYIVALTARKVDVDVAHWQDNGAGLSHSHKHGFGLLSAWRLVNAARVWRTVPWLTSYSYTEERGDWQIPKGRHSPLSIIHEVTQQDIRGLSLFIVEHVQLTVWLGHPWRGKVEVKVISPAGTVSVLAATRPKDNSSNGFNDWTFTTVRCWGETPTGNWTLRITDHDELGKYGQGSLSKYRLTLFGTPMTPTEFQQRREEVEASMTGEFLHPNYSLHCPPPPKYQSLYAPVSERALKIIILSGIFLVVMAVYETFEYLLCYNDEKREAQQAVRTARRAARLAQEAVGDYHRDSEQTAALLEEPPLNRNANHSDARSSGSFITAPANPPGHSGNTFTVSDDAEHEEGEEEDFSNSSETSRLLVLNEGGGGGGGGDRGRSKKGVNPARFGRAGAARFPEVIPLSTFSTGRTGLSGGDENAGVLPSQVESSCLHGVSDSALLNGTPGEPFLSQPASVNPHTTMQNGNGQLHQ